MAGVHAMQRIGFIVFPDFEVLSLDTATVFEVANMVAQEQLYDLHVLSEAGGAVRTSIGMAVNTEAFDETAFDTVIVAGTLLFQKPLSPTLIAYVRKAPERCRRVASICTGARVLAEAGLLDGRRATTHWLYGSDLAAHFPRVEVEQDRMFISDGAIWTSAGMTGCIDLALAMVENDHGRNVARSVAQHLVVFHRRAGSQSQYSALLELEPKSDRIQSALVYAKNNLDSPLSVDQLADAAHLSPRQFSRAFRAETGQSPAKAVERLRVEAARLMIEQGRHSIDLIARETGFGDRHRMRRAFMRATGIPPQAVRRSAREEALTGISEQQSEIQAN
jgi:transcriptional regulator GlxA family with amidase domain